MAKPAESYSKHLNHKSVSKTLAILSTFDESTPMQRTSDIALKLDMNISTVSRHLNTMLDWGFLERDDVTGLYHLGLEIVALAGAALQNNDIYRHAYPELQQLSNKYQIHSHMGVPRGVDVVHLISISCENTMELLIPMGHCHPMYCSAMGRAILAYKSEDEVDRILRNSSMKKHTINTKTEADEIKQELMVTRQRGFNLLSGELSDGKASIAAPVFDRNRVPVASISVSASLHRLGQHTQQSELSKAVITAAGKISAKLGYYPR